MTTASVSRTTGLLGVATVGYVLLGLLGRTTIVPGDVLALVWPAAGGAIVLVALLPWRWWPAGAAALGLGTFALNALAGASALVALSFVLPNVLQGLVGALLLRRTAPHLAVAGGTATLQTFRDYVALIATASVSSVVAVLSGTLMLSSLASLALAPLAPLAWAGRNAVGALVVLTLLSLLLGVREERAPSTVDTEESTSGRRVELAGLVVVSVVLYAVALSGNAGVPLAFPLLVPTVWAGLRFGLAVVTLHSLAIAVAVVVATLQGTGPFAEVATGHGQALLAQTFMGMVLVVGVLLALASEERRLLARTLRGARDAASNQATLLATVIDSMREGVALLDSTGTILLQNPAGESLLHRTEAEGLRQPVQVRDTAGRPLPQDQWPYARALRGEEVVGAEVVLDFGEDALERDLSISAQRLPFPSEEGLDQAVVIFHDVTSERAHRQALESFARTVAHDLKGPLAVAEGWAELLAADATGSAAVPAEAVREPTERILDATGTMRTLIADLLDRSLARDQQPRFEHVDLRELVAEVVEQHRGVSGPAPVVDVVGVLPAVTADRSMLRQVLHNLVGNAVKYVVPGEVPQVCIRARSLGEMVEVVVADRGIGIPEGQQDAVFGVFTRAHGAAAYEGQGIGLSVCKTIVRRHGGTIRARSRADGPGAELVMTLPGVDQVVGGRG